jgi:endogenous inhibitor of DNA gyrase (YacG/DUF329 family)
VIILAKTKKKAGKKAGNMAYCVKCRKKVVISNPKQIKLKNKRLATKGKCPKCGTGVFRIGG